MESILAESGLMTGDMEDTPIVRNWKDNVDKYREAWESSEECLLRLYSKYSLQEVALILEVSCSYLYVLVREAKEALGVEITRRSKTLISDLRFDYQKWLEAEKREIQKMFSFKLSEDDMRTLLLWKCYKKEAEGRLK